VFRELGLTESSFHVLCLLVASDNGMASPSELSDSWAPARANMTRILDSLVEDGLATRAVEPRGRAALRDPHHAGRPQTNHAGGAAPGRSSQGRLPPD